MRRAIKLYVSAGRDVGRERDVIGRVVAGLPVTAGWEIGSTPLAGQPVSPAGAPAAAIPAPDACDLFIFVLGQDITAPAGSSPEELEREARAWLVRRLLERADRLRLTLPEIEALAALSERLKAEEAPARPPEQPGGAGGSGIILSLPPGSR